MKPTRGITVLVTIFLASVLLHPHSLAAQTLDLIAAVKAGDAAKVNELLPTPGQPQVRDERGNTALHWAALANDAPLVVRLLAGGFDARATNAAGATPLHYGTGDDQTVRDLLQAGADPNARSVAGVTPLHGAAARPDSFATVKRLLDAGAKVDAPRPVFPVGEVTALTLAANAGNERVVRLLLDHGAAPGGTKGITPVTTAAFGGHEAILKELVARGGAVNMDDGFTGHALNTLLYAGHRRLAPFLIERGADLHQTSTFGERVPPIVWSAYTETGDVELTRLLLDRGVDINEPTGSGATALDWAMKRGETPLTQFLRNHGAKNGVTPLKKKPVPHNAVPDDRAGRRQAVRDSVQRAVNLLQRASDGFLANGFVKQSACVSCHHQTLPAVAFARARERGFAVDEPSLARQIHVQHDSWSKTRDQAYEMYDPQPAPAAVIGYGMLGLHALRYEPDELTAAMVWNLAAMQLPDGSWADYDFRPPMEGGQITGTALMVNTLRLYPQPVKNTALEKRIERARRWLERSQPADLNQHVFRVLGLGWAGAKPAELQPQIQALLALQRPDGGWAPLPTLGSDAWATGHTLFALQEAGGLPASDERYRRGVDFLLRTQFADGSWWVPSRTWPFQPHFDSGFPHGKDQWISAGGTAWAVIALLSEIEPAASRESFLTAQALMAKHPKPAAEATKAPSAAAKETTTTATADPAFTRDILPIFKLSCVNCHSGEKPKGTLSVESVAGLLKGGQSGEPAIVPGKSDASPLIRYVSDQLEDLEMPPLPKRTKYPALTKEQIATIHRWINDGAH